MSPKVSAKPAPRRTRSDGERSRGAILSEAARLATVEGLNGLTLARLAEAVGMSKSGLFAHFGSKEELQLATVDHARSVFAVEVLLGASAAPSGIERLRLLTENFLRHVEGRTYPGGCFFASTAVELAGQPGPVRERILKVENDYIGRIRAAVKEAQDEGAIAADEDADQLTFELVSYLIAANMQFAITQDGVPMANARRAIERRLADAA